MARSSSRLFSGLMVLLSLSAIHCGDDAGPPTPEGAADADAAMGAVLDLQQVTALSDSLFDYDPTIDPTATPEQNATAIGDYIRANLGGCGSVTVMGAVATVDFGSPPGCTVLGGLRVSGSVTASVSRSGATTIVTIDVSMLTVNGRRLGGTFTFSTTSGASFMVSSPTSPTMVTVSGSMGSITTMGMLMVAGARPSAAILMGVVWRRGDCYPSAGSIMVTTGSITQTVAFSPSTANSGVASRTVAGMTVPYTLPAYGSCPTSMPDAGSGMDAGGIDGGGGVDAGAGLCPLDISGAPAAIGRLAAGSDFNCVRLTDDEMYCWGTNDGGQLGLGTVGASVPRSTFSCVDDAVSVSCGTESCCAMTTGGGVRCWGRLPDGTSLPPPVPLSVPIAGLTGVVDVSARGPACAVLTDGTVQCWGSDNRFGDLGDGTIMPRATPAMVMGITDAVRVETGGGEACALHMDGTLSCWGKNNWGELGIGVTSARQVIPMPVVGLTDVIDFSVSSTTCAIAGADRQLYCWGYGESGAVGDGAMMNRSAPAMVSGMTSILAVSCAIEKCCAVTVMHELMCWGRQGIGTTAGQSAVPVMVPGLADVAGVSLGTVHGCAWDASDRVFCWGGNMDGQLGTGMLDSGSPTPIEVMRP